MANIVNGVTLPYSTVKLSKEYYKTTSGEIIGGYQTFTITGKVIVSGPPGTSTGSIVMEQLKDIRDLGGSGTNKCVTVNLPGFYNGNGKVSSVNIEQGSDPTWINEGGYTVEIITKLDSIPTNSLGITVEDCISEISRSESIDIGEDAHGYIYSGELSKSFIKFSNKINIKCNTAICTDNGLLPIENTFNALKKLVQYGPTHPEFSKYNSWDKFLQSRSIDISQEGSVNFSCDMILRPACANKYSALVDISFGHNKTYDNISETYTISGNINGLASVNWGDLVTLSDSCESSKLIGAEEALAYIKGAHSDISSWDGVIQQLTQLPNCPSTTSGNSCGSSDSLQFCIKPTSSTISKSRTEGSITFNFEWATSDGCTNPNGSRTELTIDIDDPEEKIVEHPIIRYGTLIQILNCKSAEQVTITASTTTDQCTSALQCITRKTVEEAEAPYLDTHYLIGHNETATYTSYTVRKQFIKKCSG